MSTRRRTGKVASLPHDVREQINLMLRDGVPYGKIIERLGKVGAGLSEKNVENWAKADEDGRSGYQDWCAQRERLADLQAKREFAIEVVRENAGSDIHEAALQVAASQLYEVITEFDLASIKQRLVDKPESYTDLVTALSKLSKNGLDYAKYRDRVAEQKRKMTAEISRAKQEGGLSAETLARIESALNLL